MSTPSPEPLEVGYYTVTDEFRAIYQHAAVMRADRSLVAVTGPSTGKGAMESLDYAHLFAASHHMLAALRNLVEAQRSGLLVLSPAGAGHDYLTQALDAIERAGSAPLQPLKRTKARRK